MSAFTLRYSWVLRRGASLRRRVARGALLGLGWCLTVVGAVGALLPGHLGLLPLIIGLIIVLRSSIQARRQFVSLQRRHPKVMFPIRRLLRREPEVLPVAWQQALRFERLLLPRRWRMARRIRWRFFRRR
ncbi:MAG TPA: hypothetical protein VG248_09595 [Caulobacteraceae bacterium]|jgi:hypothetical protein|nr:hypothetical protein [Caulobacteraceae bacterium]